jgi:hypothetical protein
LALSKQQARLRFIAAEITARQKISKDETRRLALGDELVDIARRRNGPDDPAAAAEPQRRVLEAARKRRRRRTRSRRRSKPQQSVEGPGRPDQVGGD